MYHASRFHHLHPLHFLPPDKEEERHCYPPEQEVWDQEALEKMVRLLPGSTLFIDEGTESPPIQISNHLLREYKSQILRHV